MNVTGQREEGVREVSATVIDFDDELSRHGQLLAREDVLDRRQLLLPVSDNYFCRSRPRPSAYPTPPSSTTLG